MNPNCSTCDVCCRSFSAVLLVVSTNCNGQQVTTTHYMAQMKFNNQNSSHHPLDHIGSLQLTPKIPRVPTHWCFGPWFHTLYHALFQYLPVEEYHHPCHHPVIIPADVTVMVACFSHHATQLSRPCGLEFCTPSWMGH